MHLGMRWEEFEATTPIRLKQLFDEWTREQKRLDYRFARICYCIAVYSGAENVTVESFMPGKKRRRRRFRQTPTDDLEKQFRAVVLAKLPPPVKTA